MIFSLLLACIHLMATRPAEPLRIPAYTAYLVPNADAIRLSSTRPVTPFVAPGAALRWFGLFRTTGSLHAAVDVKSPAGTRYTLRLAHGAAHYDRAILGTGSAVRVDFGAVAIADTGYQSLTLTLLDAQPNTSATVNADTTTKTNANAVSDQRVEIAALWLDGAPVASALFNLEARRNAASVHLRYPTDSNATITGFYTEVTAVDDPVTTYYMATGFSRGYFGMQVNSLTERRIIFSVWDAAEGTSAKDRTTVAAENHTQLVAKGEQVVASVFGNEGTGGHSHLVYPWKTGSTQRFFVTAKPEGTNTVYSGYWFHPDAQAWQLIASFRATKDGGGLKRLYSFSENFGGSTGHLRRKAFYGAQWIRLANGSWQELSTATFSHDVTGRANRLDRFMGVEDGRFFLSHGGFVPGHTETGTTFTRPSTGVPPTLPTALLH
jgi:hypothetical protein